MNNYFGVGKANGKLYLVERVQNDQEVIDTAQAIYEFIASYLAIKERPPVYREIAKHTGMSYSTINYWLRKLVEDGKIKHRFGIARGITLCKSS